MKRLCKYFDSEIIDNKAVDIFKNPSSTEIAEAKKSNSLNTVRGIIDNDGTEYCWNGDVLHFQIQSKINCNSFHFSYDDDYGWFCDVHDLYTKKEFLELIMKYEKQLSKYGMINHKWDIGGFSDYSPEIKINSFEELKEILETETNKMQTANNTLKRLIKKARLPIIQDEYNWSDFDYIDVGEKIVNVNDIVGLSDSRVDEYNDNWMPIDTEDPRWIYQQKLIEQGEQLETIPLTKTPDGKYYPNGDGNHRVSAAKVMELATVNAKVTVMIPKEVGINEAWEEHAKEKINQLDELSAKYKGMFKEFNRLQDEAFESKDYKEYRTFQKEMNEVGNEISKLDTQMRKEENEFKNDLVNEYINK
jgi:hypothetical protein